MAKKKKDEYEDISSYSKKAAPKKKAASVKTAKKKPADPEKSGKSGKTAPKKDNFLTKNNGRNLKALLSIVICLVLVICALGGAYIRKMLNLINHSNGDLGNPDATFVEEEEENLNFATMYDVESADSIKDLIKSWALNGGEKMYSRNVINVLLIGEDNEEGSHRSDSCMLASVNTKTKKITLVSFLRDTYTFMEINGDDRYDKTNHSYSWGGPAKLMEVLSNNYKVKIDYYVSINFASFIKVVDILGGVTVPITEKEASFMNQTTKVAGFTSGENVNLNGERALIYSRIRKLDSEIERTRRQRCVITSVIQNVKASSLADLNKAIETFLPYVTTNLKTSQILSYGTQALRENWLKYEITGMVEPSDDFREGINGFRTYSGYLDVWICDYISAAREVQLALYGKTNIEINPETHISAIDLALGGKSSSSYDDDDDYGYDGYRYYDDEDEVSTKYRGPLDWRRFFADSGEEETRRRTYDYDEEDENPSEGFSETEDPVEDTPASEEPAGDQEEPFIQDEDPQAPQNDE